MENNQSSRIIKELIFGFLIIKRKRIDGSRYIDIEPLSSGWDYIDIDDDMISAEDEIIAAIPAPESSFRILGLFENDFYMQLGYEFKGADNPDWINLLDDRIRIKEEMKEVAEKIKKGDIEDAINKKKFNIISKEEAMSHVVSSTNYWKGDTIDNSYYLNNLGLEKAFECAVWHVKNSHGVELDEGELKEAKERVGLI